MNMEQADTPARPLTHFLPLVPELVRSGNKLGKCQGNVAMSLVSLVIGVSTNSTLV